jgi:hypothetical protein
MKTNKLSISGFLIALFLFISPVLALPCAFYGQVQLDGLPTNGTNVEAYYLNGTLISKGKEPPAGFGHYSIAVNAPGQNVMLKIKGISIDQGNKFCDNGALNYINISATTPPTTTTTTVQQSSDGYNGGGGGTRYYNTITNKTTTTTINKTTTTTVAPQSTTTTEGEKLCLEGCESNTTVVTTTIPQVSGITGKFLSGIYSRLLWLIPIIALVIVLIVWVTRKTKPEEKKEPEKTEISEENNSQSTIDNFTATNQDATNQETEN